MKKRIFQSMCLLAILAIAMTTLLQGVFFTGELYQAMKQQLVHEAVCLTEAMDKNDADYLERVSLHNPETRITLIDKDGEVVFDSRMKQYEKIENHNERPEVVEARQSGSGRRRAIQQRLARKHYIMRCFWMTEEYFVWAILWTNSGRIF